MRSELTVGLLAPAGSAGVECSPGLVAGSPSLMTFTVTSSAKPTVVQTLAPIALQVDIVAKGCYVNATDRKHERAWVRWSVEQVDPPTETKRPGTSCIRQG